MKVTDKHITVEGHRIYKSAPESLLQIATTAAADRPGSLLGFVARLSHDGLLKSCEFVGKRTDLNQLANSFAGKPLSKLVPDNLWQKLRLAINGLNIEQTTQIFTTNIVLNKQSYVLELMVAAIGPDLFLLISRDLTEQKVREKKAVAVNRSLISVQAAASAISLNLELNKVLETFNWEMSHLLDSSGCSIYFLHSGADHIALAASYSTEKTGDQIHFAPACKLGEFPFLEQITQDRIPIQIDLVDGSYASVDLSDLLAMGVTAILLLPMVFQDRILGLAKVILWQTDRRFTEQEISLAQLLTNQAAAAVANAHLYDETQERLREQTALRQASAIFSSSLEQEKIFQRIAEHLCSVVELRCVTIREYDSSNSSGCVVGQHLKDPELAESLYTFLHHHVINFSPQAVTAFEAGALHSWLKNDREIPDQVTDLMERIQADIKMDVPMSVAGRTIAIAELWGQRQGRRFEINEIELVRSICQQAAIAIENARLYQELDGHLDELSTLNKIGQAISSTLDLEETLTIMTESALKLLDSSDCSVVLVNDDGKTLRYAAASGSVADFIIGREMSINDGIVGWVIRTGEAALIQNVRQDGRHYQAFDHQSGFKTEALICVPLQSRGNTIGAISIFNKAKGRFTENDLRLLNSLAIPATTAIENAVLFQRAGQEIEERKRAEADLEAERASLAHRVEERTMELKTANETLGRAARLKDEFLASMSHELRTPLNAILGISQGLLEQFYGPHNERQLKSLSLIHDSGRHLLELINDILDISKIEAQKLTIKSELVSVQDVCAESVRLITEAAYTKKISLNSHIDDNVTMIYADHRRLKQILINLLSNAVKFTPAGGQVGLAVILNKAEDTVNFEVWDTGIGIPKENRDQLFQPFVQLDSRLSRNYSGTGLGLALVQRLTILHGGKVTLESKIGEGCRFVVSLPRRSDIPLPRQKDGHNGKLMSASIPLSQQEPIADNPNILLVDDDEFVATIFADLLGKMGCTIVRARNGIEAIEAYKKQKPSLILMDIQMPEMDGLEAMKHIREIPGSAEVPIIALTAMAMAGDREICLAAGADEYISKPVPLQTLKATIEQYLA